MLGQLGIAQGFGQLGQRVLRRHRKDKPHLTQGHVLDVGRHVLAHDHAQGQVGLARGQSGQGARQGFVANAQPGRAFEGQKSLAQVHHHALRNDAVHRHREQGFPTGGHPFDPVGHHIDVVQQAARFTQQFFASGRRAGLAGTAVKQQHIQGVFDLPHAVSQGAGHQVEFAGGRGKTAFRLDGLQHEQGIGREPIFGALHGGAILIEKY